MRTPAPWIRSLLLGAALVGLMGTPTTAQTFSSGSTGADGSFAPTCSPTPCTVWVQLPPSGVFNFTTISVPQGVTVVLTRNAANTPAVLLATGAVTVDGTLEVNGSDATAYGRPGRGAPGGFDGGAGADFVTTTVGGAGLGPGGGGGGSGGTIGGGGGGFGTAGGGSNGGPTYGGPALRPILGGSGGGGGGAGSSAYGAQTGGGGGGGGGALLLASSTSITLIGHLDGGGRSILAIRANGGAGSSGWTNGGGGSGGAVRLVAPTIAGNAPVVATGGTGEGTGGAGRIRLEAITLTYSGQTTPFAATSYPQAVFPGTGQPSLTIASVGGIPAPASPSGNILAAPDILLPTGTTNPVEVVLTASNIPLGTAIVVTATPQSGAKSTATSTGLTGSSPGSTTATASLTLSLTQTSVLTASATFPLVARLGSGPLYAEGPVPSRVQGPVPSIVEGEEVTHVKVAAVFGGATSVTYLTRSGREVSP